MDLFQEHEGNTIKSYILLNFFLGFIFSQFNSVF